MVLMSKSLLGRSQIVLALIGPYCSASCPMTSCAFCAFTPKPTNASANVATMRVTKSEARRRNGLS